MSMRRTDVTEEPPGIPRPGASNCRSQAGLREAAREIMRAITDDLVARGVDLRRKPSLDEMKRLLAAGLRQRSRAGIAGKKMFQPAELGLHEGAPVCEHNSIGSCTRSTTD